MKKTTARIAPATSIVRCAIYTRKSSEEGLEQEFNSLDAQRESGEAFIRSQAGEGWTCLSDRYDDGGFTGGNLDRPALRRLLADVEAGRIDCVVVYKVDRLSRSLLDFARLMAVFDQHQVAFAAVTQQFNTATSMGRLVLNVLLSFAQFEREIIAERTRDKIAAARRKGKWSGGMPLLGYDVDAASRKLVVNAAEAERVRAIFDLYLEHEGLLPVVQELDRRGWANKQWTTRKGRTRGGRPFTKTSLYALLTNVTYAGKVRYKDEVHEGEQAAIVDAATWQKVQAMLQRNGRAGGSAARGRCGALLQGLLRCTPCGCAMTPAHSTKGAKRYRYYTCTAAQKKGWQCCPSKSVPAGQMEAFVVEQIRCIGRDPAVLRETLAQAQSEADRRRAELDAERRSLERDLARWHADVRSLAAGDAADGPGATAARLADLQERIGTAERRLTEVREAIAVLGHGRLDEELAAETLAAFDPVWAALTPQEQARMLQLLVERIDYDGGQGKVSITFHPTGIAALANQLAAQRQEQTV